MTYVTTQADVRVRHRAIDDDGPLQTLVNSLTLEQLRYALFGLAPTKKIALRSHKDATDALVKTGRSTDQIVAQLLHIEATTPAKHCLVNSCSTGLGSLLSTVKTSFENRGFVFRISHREDSELATTITFEHTVSVKVWVSESDDVLRKRSVPIRHPIVLRYLKGTGAAIFFFPGFSQGDAVDRSERVGYDVVMAALIEGLMREFRTHFVSLPIEAAIGSLAEGQNERVRIVRSDVEARAGRIGVAARLTAERQNSVEDVIASFVAPYLKGIDQSELRTAIATAFRGCPANALVVSWIKENFVTRLSFWEIGTEFFFIWRGANQSLHLVDGVVGLLVELAQQISGAPQRSAWEELTKVEAGVLVLAGNFAAHHSMSGEQAAALFVKGVKAGVLRPVYRLRTNEELSDYMNEWTPELVSLRKRFMTLGGNEVDGGNPSNIEVGFERAGEVTQR